jgi:hypothetical protein
MLNDDLETRLQIAESGYGQEYGWYVERDGKRLAILTEPKFADMFWVQYRIEPLSQAPAIVAALFEDTYWSSPKYTFRNRKFPQHEIEAFGPVDSDRCHAELRGLYLEASFSWWERCRCWRRLWRARRKLEHGPLQNLEPESAI